MGRRRTLTYLCASSLISIQLLSSANRGASGKAATKIVTNPYWMTGEERRGTQWAVEGKGEEEGGTETG